MKKIELCAVGGYGEMGRNMTALKCGDDVVILDMGLHLEHYIRLTEDEDTLPPADELIAANAVPDIAAIRKWRSLVRAIIPSHAHLDHVGAVPFLAAHYPDAEILGTPYTMAVLNTILRDNKQRLPNQIRSVAMNSFYTVSGTIRAEFINVTHSTPHSAMIALHTPRGVVLYCNDFKFDLYPTLGKKTNTERLRKLGRKGVLALIIDSTYSRTDGKMPSESIAKDMLRDVLLGNDAGKHLIVMTTFSSHIARINSAIGMGQRLRRKILLLGRSLGRYVGAAEELGIVDFTSKAELKRYGSQIRRRLRKIPASQRGKYLLIMTGHQAEPKATLSKIVNRDIEFGFRPGDHIIFSCKTIPTPTNIKNREEMEKKLKRMGVRIFKDIHVSGHGAKEDIRELIEMVRPRHVIPSHGFKRMLDGTAAVCHELGYKRSHIHLLRHGDTIGL